MAGNNQTETET